MHNTRHSRAATAAALLAVAAAGCSGWLTEPDAARDPNQATEATRNQLFVGVQAGQFGVQESGIAQIVCMFMQQCAGVNGRFVEQRSQYNFTDNDFSPDFVQVYAGGGLVDLRAVEASAEAAGDLQYLGIAQIWEAFIVGTAADVWGDVPFSEAADPTIAAPRLDPQIEVYAAVQALLTEAIANLQGAGPGPGINDLVFGGDVDAWTEVAWTLKARYHLHTVERLGVERYDDAIAAALNGISTPDHDFRALHSAPTSERNIWYQFSQTSFGADLVAGKTLVDVMNAQNDPRRAAYFGAAPEGGFGGALPDRTQSPNGASPVDGTRNDPLFRQPFVTYAENELILAEAYNRRGDDPSARTHLDNARALAPLPAVAATLAGDALFAAIMQEKYIALFQNIEVWNDYKRTCFPGIPIVPYDGGVTPNVVPGRLFYGQSERNANPNVPSTADQLSRGGVGADQPSVGGFRNPNDPDPCP
jgi:hypothetical protein